MIKVLYSTALLLLTPALLLYFLLRSRKDPAYRKRFSERLALQPVPTQAVGGM
tara:strand:+ start:86 stop:244 length:159 start_codon:yes stop_codon:yes gene_type:complete